MKKLLFIFFTLITFTNVSYASFPVSVNVQNKVIESQVVEFQDPLRNIGRISLTLSLLGILLMALQGFLDPNAFIAGYFLFGVLLLFIAFVFFVIWTTNKKWAKWFWLSFLALTLLLPLANESESSFFNN